MRGFVVCAILTAALLAPASAQTQQTPSRILSAGYSTPSPLKAAPGQIITLFVNSTQTAQPEEKITAAGFPLPLQLGEYSVSLDQTLYPSPVGVPIFSVEPMNQCYGLTPSVCVKLMAITVQVPWELVPNRPRSARPENFGILTVSFRGIKGDAFPLQPELDSIHVISSCDAPTPPGMADIQEPSGPCRSWVTHLDGNVVTAANPAAPGEVVYLYAFGLGKTEGTLHTGDVVRAPVPFSELSAGFQIGVNLEPVRPDSAEELAATASLVEDQVGLYRIRMVIPAVPEETRACTASTIASNLTLSIGRQQSFGGAGICVQP